jgi:hypothetical protein
VYEAAARDGYEFVTSNTAHPDVMKCLLDGAAAAEDDVVPSIE